MASYRTKPPRDAAGAASLFGLSISSQFSVSHRNLVLHSPLPGSSHSWGEVVVIATA